MPFYRDAAFDKQSEHHGTIKKDLLRRIRHNEKGLKTISCQSSSFNCAPNDSRSNYGNRLRVMGAKVSFAIVQCALVCVSIAAYVRLLPSLFLFDIILCVFILHCALYMFAKALAASLVHNTRITRLDLQDNALVHATFYTQAGYLSFKPVENQECLFIATF